MKILFLSHAQYITVGLPKIIEQAENLVEQGHEVTLVATSRTNRFFHRQFSKNGVKYFLSPSILWGKFRHGADIWDTINRIIYLIRHFDFDIIHCIDSRPTVILPGIILKKLRKVPLVIEWSDLYSDGGTIVERSSLLYKITVGRIEAFFEKKFRRFADGAVVVTSFLKKKLIELGYPSEKILIHKMGAKINKQKLMKKKQAREKLGIDDNSIIIGHLGRIYKRDLKLLVESYKLVKPFFPNLKISMIGAVNKKYRIKEEGIEYLGFVNEDKYRYYCNAVDFFILPLHISTTNLARWPSKIGDYVSFARPLISTKVSDVEDIFSQYNIGVLADSDTPESLSGAIIKAIKSKKYSKKYIEWCENALIFAKTELDLNILNNLLINFYEEIL